MEILYPVSNFGGFLLKLFNPNCYGIYNDLGVWESFDLLPIGGIGGGGGTDCLAVAGGWDKKGADGFLSTVNFNLFLTSGAGSGAVWQQQGVGVRSERVDFWVL